MTLPPGRYPSKQINPLPNRDLMRAPIPVGVANVFTRSSKGETSFTAGAGTFSFIVPSNVRFISTVCIGFGGSVAGGIGGHGGGLAWKNRIAVFPGESLTVVISSVLTAIYRDGTTGDMLCGATAATSIGPGYPIVGQGGTGGTANSRGGAGAGGYMGGGSPGSVDANGGAAAGGGPDSSEAGGGGGTGLTGLTPAFTFAAGGSSVVGGGAGVGGSSGQNGHCTTVCVCCPPHPCTTYFGGNGGNYGGGAGAGFCINGSPAIGAARIIWPGETRLFPYGAT